MLVQAWAQKEKRPDYISAPWQPEPELATSPPRPVSFSTRFKITGVAILIVVGLMGCFASLPTLKHAYVMSEGVATNGTIQQRYSRQNPKRRANLYFLAVRYETPSGRQFVRIQASESYYARNFKTESVPLHYLTRFPSVCVLDDDHFYTTWQVLIVVGVGIILLWLQYYMYSKMRALAERGKPVKGLITKINQRPRNRYLTVYYELQGEPYAGTMVVRPNQNRAEWQVGRAITVLVASEPADDSHRSHAVMIYPASEFKVKQ